MQSDAATAGSPLPVPASSPLVASRTSQSPALDPVLAASAAASPALAQASPLPTAAVVAPLGVQSPASAELSANPQQQLLLPEAAAGPILPPGSSPLSPSLRYAAVAQQAEHPADDGVQLEALLPAAPLPPSVEEALVQPAAANTPAAGTPPRRTPASEPVEAVAAVAHSAPEAALLQQAATAAAAAATSPDPFRPTAASGFQPFTPVAPQHEQQQLPHLPTPDVAQAEVELAPEEPPSAIRSPGAPLAEEPVAVCSFEPTCQTQMGGAAVTPVQQFIAGGGATGGDASATATPVPSTPAALIAAPLHDSASSQAPGGEPPGEPVTELAAAASTAAPLPAASQLPDSTSTLSPAGESVAELAAAVPAAAALPNSISTQLPAVELVAELAAAPTIARKLAVSFAEPAAVADCTVSGAWSASPPALAATGGAVVAAMPAAYSSPPCAAATQEPAPSPPSAARTPQAATLGSSPGTPQLPAGKDASCSVDRLSVATNMAFVATPPGASAASLQVCRPSLTGSLLLCGTRASCQSLAATPSVPILQTRNSHSPPAGHAAHARHRHQRAIRDDRQQAAHHRARRCQWCAAADI
jgi:hypothetical protein